jgi:oxygen-independent coproporphyrinogen III oxidase
MQTQITRSPATPQGVLAPSADVLRRLEMNGPRYTSYPTADRFVEAFGAAEYATALRQRAEGAAVGGVTPLSLYVHIPFCESVCYYCACNKVVTRHHDRAGDYLQALATEVQLHQDVLGAGAAVSQLHLGGGTPTFLSDDELTQLMQLLRRSFRIVAGAELSIEVDPRTASPGRLQHWQSLGFNRLSLGVQDFDPAVQQAVNRVQPSAMVQQLMQQARSLAFESVNVDLILGLPKQTPASFARTIEEVAHMRPDRLALYTYAHLPERFKPQRRIDVSQLPSAADRLAMQAHAINSLLAAGYIYVGMDHFALPGDALAVAKRQGRLHRNFQGYSTQADCDLVGLGVSAIGRVGATYSQNAKTLAEYCDALKQGQFPVVRGIALARDDLLRRAVIMAVMCQGRLEYEAMELAQLVDVRRYFAAEFEQLKALQDQGLVDIGAEALQVTAAGWFFVRAVAMVFDRHLQSNQARERFSRII